MNREEKGRAVEELRDRLSRAKVAILANYRGLNVAQMNELRRQLREAQIEFRVVKNTIALRAARECNLAIIEKWLEGPTAMALGFQDPTTAARLFTKFMAGEKKLQFKTAILGGRPITLPEVTFLAELPPLDGMRARFVGTLVSPQRRLLGVLGGVPRRFLGVLSAYEKSKEAKASEAVAAADKGGSAGPV